VLGEFLQGPQRWTAALPDLAPLSAMLSLAFPRYATPAIRQGLIAQLLVVDNGIFAVRK